MRQPTIGTIIEGTLDTYDLMDAFESELEMLDPAAYATLRESWENDPDVDPWSEDGGDEARSEYVSELEDALNDTCPPYMYFGSHPGDGADFGFWVDIDTLNDDLHYAESCAIHPDCKYMADENLCVEINDHGNVTLYRHSTDRTEVWSIV